ncbi:MAG: pyridoxine 5'-phosphate synthase [Spirochaetota bacterium]
MINLSVNVNKIATLRNSRGGNIPDLKKLTRKILDCGVQGITVHPRSDARHITSQDTQDVKELIASYNQKNGTQIEYNIEGEPSERFLKIIQENKPTQATLVPVKPGEITSDHGFDFSKDTDFLAEKIAKLKKQEVRIALFVEAGVKDLHIAKEIGADRIELYTGPYAEDFSRGKVEESFAIYQETALQAEKLGLGVNAGHDLDVENLQVFRQLPGLEEVSIGHRLISYALEVGLETAVKQYLKTLLEGNGVA